MATSPYKHQPLDKTLALEFKAQVADINNRKKVLQGSIASKIDLTSNFVAGDANVSDMQPFNLLNIKTAVMIHSYKPFTVDIINGSTSALGLACTGVFIFYGAISSLTIKAEELTRFTYVYA